MNDLCFDRYPPEAFAFVSESLAQAAADVHGPMTSAHATLAGLMHLNNLTADDLAAHYLNGDLDQFASRLVEDIGGPDAIDRHVTGADLCRTLRRLASDRWGLLARTVLASWNITRTLDFGRIVFEMVDKGRLSKKPEDSLEDFDDVYDLRDLDNVAVNPDVT